LNVDVDGRGGGGCEIVEMAGWSNIWNDEFNYHLPSDQ
jgi:hypothetical protein